MTVAEPQATNNGSWAEWLMNKPGTLYKNADNPWIQEFGVFGRFQWQAAYLDGKDTNGYSFGDSYTDFRRFRLGAKLKFLNYFTIKSNVNMVFDTSNNVSPWPGGHKVLWGYQNFDESTISFDIKKAFGVDSVDSMNLHYGRHKIAMSQEAHISSKKIITVERSGISNKLYGSRRPTALSFDVAKGDWSGTFGLLSTDALTHVGGNVEWLGGWNDGLAYYTSLGYSPCEQWHFGLDFLYNNADVPSGDDRLFGYKWATSLSGEYNAGHWGFIFDGIYGDNGGHTTGIVRPDRRGRFWGVVLTPYYWIVEDKLQGVVRYQYAGSKEGRGIRVNSRYMRKSHGPTVAADTFSGRGNEHHSIYGGLNYLIAGHNLKVQAGIEYEWMNVPGAGLDGDFSGLTYWFAFRSYF